MIKLSPESVQVVMAALDLAVKSGGLQAAQQILPIAAEISRQLNEDKAEE
tara:strand:+ start:123 stop:272 length:150 start_codon:yes stop_codon:yes gene_type:complete